MVDTFVGVMIAAALIPAAAVGIGIVWNVPAITLGAFVLLVVNAASIHLSAVATFWYLGYRPTFWDDLEFPRNLTFGRLAPSLLVVLLLAGLFVVVGGPSPPTSSSSSRPPSPSRRRWTTIGTGNSNSSGSAWSSTRDR